MLKGGRDRVLLPALDRVIEALVAMGIARRRGDAVAHPRPARDADDAGQGAREFRPPPASRAQGHRRVSLTGQDQRRGRELQRPPRAYPDFDWESFARRFVESLGLEFNPLHIQIEPHDTFAEQFDAFARANTVLLDLDRGHLGLRVARLFQQKTRAGEVGSSTMPHKVNPIDFENSEGNLGVANALLRHLSEKLPVSRWQRDLSDSTVQRTSAVALGPRPARVRIHAERPLQARGRSRPHARGARRELGGAGEAVQTVMRRYGLPIPTSSSRRSRAASASTARR